MKPILFNTPMVQAILKNRKFQTRRVIKYNFEKVYKSACFHGKWHETFRVGPSVLPADIVEWYVKEVAKPKYKVGDICYVRETWANPLNDFGGYIYKATCWDDVAATTKWHPSIHMPKEAARIFLRVTNVRVERVQDITEDDAKAEGVTYRQAIECNGWHPTYNDPDSGGCLKYRAGFQYLWESINRKRGYGWNKNPWVFV